MQKEEEKLDKFFQKFQKSKDSGSISKSGCSKIVPYLSIDLLPLSQNFHMSINSKDSKLICRIKQVSSLSLPKKNKLSPSKEEHWSRQKLRFIQNYRANSSESHKSNFSVSRNHPFNIQSKMLTIPSNKKLKLNEVKINQTQNDRQKLVEKNVKGEKDNRQKQISVKIQNNTLIRMKKSQLEQLISMKERLVSDSSQYDNYLKIWQSSLFSLVNPKWNMANKLIIINTKQRTAQQFLFHSLSHQIQVSSSLILQYVSCLLAQQKEISSSISLYLCILCQEQHFEASFFWINHPILNYKNSEVLRDMAIKIEYLIHPDFDKLKVMPQMNKIILYIFNMWGCLSFVKLNSLIPVIRQIRQKALKLKELDLNKNESFYYKYYFDRNYHHRFLENKELKYQKNNKLAKPNQKLKLFT